MRVRGLSFASALVLALPAVLSPLRASIVGVSQPALSLTKARVEQLPAGKRGRWLAYLRRSAEQKAAGKRELAKEREGLKEIPLLPEESNSAHSIPLHRAAEFYKSAEARRIGDVILSFQTPAGGWSKNLNMAGSKRLRGQSYAAANLAPVASGPGDFDKPEDPNWHYVGTLDNDATNTELHFLAELAAAFPGRDGDVYRASFLRGIEYLLRAQFPNGGWPQVWPLEGGYHDAITYNDDAVTESAEMLTLVAQGQRVTTQPRPVDAAMKKFMQSVGRPIAPQYAAVEDYSFVPAALRARAKAAVTKALACILATQVRVAAKDGKGTVLTIWAQQHDPLTLKPESGRNFEVAALSAGESADVMEYLMELPRPSAAVVRSIEAAAAWFEANKIMGYVWSGGRGTPGGRKLTAQAGAGPLWARYYSLTSRKPVFGDRDKTIHDNVMDLSLERRNGYAWYGTEPQEALTEFVAWKRAHAAK